MKNTRLILLLGALVALAFTACREPKPNEKEEEKPFYMERGAYLYLNIAETPNTMKTETETLEEGNVLLSPYIITKYAKVIVCQALDELDSKGERYLEGTLGIGDDQRDLENNRIKMYASMIIEQRPEMVDGKRTMVWQLKNGWLKARDVTIRYGLIDPIPEEGVVTPKPNDVIAYIPNKNIIEAEQAIRKAWEAKDTKEVYRLFHEAYTFIPITHNEWLKLKEKGEL